LSTPVTKIPVQFTLIAPSAGLYTSEYLLLQGANSPQHLAVHEYKEPGTRKGGRGVFLPELQPMPL